MTTDPNTTSARAPAPGTGGVAVAVVTGPDGVLAGRRRDGTPLWVFPGGRIEAGETPAQAAVRECAEETGVIVAVRSEIGQRVHPVTDRCAGSQAHRQCQVAGRPAALVCTAAGSRIVGVIAYGAPTKIGA